MHYYLYEIKNNINGMKYVGVHKTKVLDDGYMGSGKVIKHAIEKHGIENFTKTILERFTSAGEMFAREKEIVNEEFLSRDDVYNLRRGGFGGFDHINKMGGQGARLNAIVTQEMRSRGGKKGSKITNATIEHKEHMRKLWNEIQGKATSAARDANAGTIIINDGTINKRLKKEIPIPTGWYKGRIKINS